MLLAQTFLLAALAPVPSHAPHADASNRATPKWSIEALAAGVRWPALGSLPPCVGRRPELAAPCLPNAPELRFSLIPVPSLDARHAALALPAISEEMGGTLGGFMNVDIMNARRLNIGPRVSWLTPDSPREDLLRLRVVASGWGVSYEWRETAISFGVTAGPRFVMMGEYWPVIDRMNSEARVELPLP